MADQTDQQTQGQQQQSNDGGSDDKETAFWDKLKGHVKEVVDGSVEEALSKRDGVRQSRGERRTTLPDILANLMFGPEKKNN